MSRTVCCYHYCSVPFYRCKKCPNPISSSSSPQRDCSCQGVNVSFKNPRVALSLYTTDPCKMTNRCALRCHAMAGMTCPAMSSVRYDGYRTTWYTALYCGTVPHYTRLRWRLLGFKNDEGDTWAKTNQQKPRGEKEVRSALEPTTKALS